MSFFEKGLDGVEEVGQGGFLQRTGDVLLCAAMQKSSYRGMAFALLLSYTEWKSLSRTSCA